MYASPTHATTTTSPSCTAGRLTGVTVLPVAAIDAHGALDALEAAVRSTVDDEAAWLETQLALLRRAMLQLRPVFGDAIADPRAAQAERTLHLVAAAFRERLTTLDAAAAALRSE